MFAFEDTSAILTVYAYFMCGCPAKVLLGRFFTGKIIFVVVAFAALILGTVFQNGMVTLLSEHVRYPNIETLSELQDSDLLVQTQDIDDRFLYFDQESHDGLGDKLITNYEYYKEIINSMYHDYESPYFFAYYALVHLRNGSAAPEFEKKAILPILESATISAETDAFVFSIPNRLISHQNFRVRSIVTLRDIEYHHIRDCFLTYPATFRVLKNCFFFEAFDRMMSRIFETGQIRGLSAFIYNDFLEDRVAVEVMEELPRVFGMKDLQLAFIGLVAGLLVSIFAFVGELFLDLL
ncbi:unnamed protein product [Bemisia tabaci]|uniref:Ionotropic receptor n=1 Tax=Bemisia tabaci TaxID=7038 RepID=A0A9P0AQI6_BEMTA|nr:unnamed protein product [Bemisia tabaci]